jgi:hypothetical protein
MTVASKLASSSTALDLPRLPASILEQTGKVVPVILEEHSTPKPERCPTWKASLSRVPSLLDVFPDAKD